MVAGNPMATTPDSTGFLNWYCQDSADTTPRPFFPPDGCAGGFLRMSIEFPSCWDGVDLDVPDHTSHMAYRIQGNYCPPTHPIPLMSAVSEAGFDVSKVPAGQLVLSTGDRLGYGMLNTQSFCMPTPFLFSLAGSRC
jgi:hypothetical protein